MQYSPPNVLSDAASPSASGSVENEILPPQANHGFGRVAGKPMRIGLLGNFGSSNLGNEASFGAMLIFLRRHRPDADIVGICRYPERVRAKHGLQSHCLGRQKDRPRWENRIDRLMLRVPSTLSFIAHAWRTARSVDLLLVPGTGILDDFGERPSQMPLELCVWCAVASTLKRPIAFVSIGAGPIRNRLSRRLMGLAAGMANYRSYRDTASKDYVASLGVDVAGDEVYPDIVFSLAAPEIPDSAGQSPTITVGVGVMSYYGWQPGDPNGARTYDVYLTQLTRFVVWLLQRGDRVRLLIGSQADTPVVQAIMERVRLQRDVPGAAIVAEPAETLSDLMQQMLDTDVVVATRFHNIVSALNCGRPVLSLGYADKNVHLLEEFGLARFSQPVEAIDLQLLFRQFEELVTERHQIGNEIREGLGRFQDSLRQQENRLLNELI
jgi:polysaccharide pyruvyl transferase WcaK-like protein